MPFNVADHIVQARYEFAEGIHIHVCVGVCTYKYAYFYRVGSDLEIGHGRCLYYR